MCMFHVLYVYSITDSKQAPKENHDFSKTALIISIIIHVRLENFKILYQIFIVSGI